MRRRALADKSVGDTRKTQLQTQNQILGRSKTGCASPRLRLLCFTNAGNEENVYTNEGLGPRKVAALLSFCRSHSIEMLAVQLPGRGNRLKEPFIADLQARTDEFLNQ